MAPSICLPGLEQEICSNILILGSRALFLGRGKDVVPQKKKCVGEGEKEFQSHRAKQYTGEILNAWHGLISVVVMVITVVMVISDTVTEWLR